MRKHLAEAIINNSFDIDSYQNSSTFVPLTPQQSFVLLVNKELSFD